MSKVSKIMGLVAGLSTVAVLGVAVAQGVPPNPYVANPALGAGQKRTLMTSMVERGVPETFERRPQAAWIAPSAPLAAAPIAAPAERIAEVQPAPMPAARQETYSMGAAPAMAEPEPPPARMPAPRRDRG